MGFDMLLEILRSLEGFAAEVTFVRLQRYVYPDVGGYVIALDGVCATATPSTLQIEVVCAFATDMAFADMLLSVL